MNIQGNFKGIKDILIDQNLPESEKNELLVFQKAMACLEDEYIQVLQKTHPSQIAIHKINEAEANERLKMAREEKELKLLAVENLYEEEQRSIEKKFENSKKSLFERTFTSISRCDSHLVNELKVYYPDKRKKFDASLLDISRYPHDGQIMQKVVHIIPKPLNIYVSDHEKDHDFTSIRSEINNLNKDIELNSSSIEQVENKATSNSKIRKIRVTNDTENKEKAEESEVTDNEDEE